MKRRADIRFEIEDAQSLNPTTTLLKARPEDNRSLPEIFPGQFVNIKVEEPDVFLRRPISICNYDNVKNELWLMVKNVGKGSARLCRSKRGDVMEILLPLGNGFKLPESGDKDILLMGGGVGVAPLYFLGKWLRMLDLNPVFLIGARTNDDLLFTEEFEKLGEIYLSTEDGSKGSKGLITQNPILNKDWSQFYVCGPTPMMKAIGGIATDRKIGCQVSLENKMACGLGACLCCVEDTKHGNVCTCTEGPVFDIKDLKW